MTLLAQQNAATFEANRNFDANRAALAKAQRSLSINLTEPAEWLFARDGYLTARDTDGQWLTGCSLPRRTAEQILRKLNVGGAVACFLAPAHAAQIRVALDRLSPRQAIIAIVPDATDLSTILSCDDFADEITSHRLWFVTGNWETDLRKLLQENPGLNLPTQFIRLPTTPAQIIDPMIPAAQKVFSEVTAARAVRIRSLREHWRSGDRICLVAPSRFRLWQEHGRIVRETLGPTAVCVDLDDPAGSSPLAIALAAQDCAAIITIDTGRADSPGLLADDLPWITWITSRHVPTFAGAGRNDHLLVTDDSIREDASDAGWPSDRVHLCGLPARQRPPEAARDQHSHILENIGMPSSGDSHVPRALAVIENTMPIAPPEDLIDFSSHLILWEMIAADLTANPFALGGEVEAYLSRQADKLQIAPDTVDRARFIRDLILPAYAQGIARALIGAGLPIKLVGRGWDRIDEFAPHAAGAIATREAFESVVDAPLALVYVWPWPGAHPIDTLGKPVLRAEQKPNNGDILLFQKSRMTPLILAGNLLQRFVRSAKHVLNQPALPPQDSPPAFSLDLVKNILDQARSDS